MRQVIAVLVAVGLTVPSGVYAGYLPQMGVAVANPGASADAAPQPAPAAPIAVPRMAVPHTIEPGGARSEFGAGAFFPPPSMLPPSPPLASSFLGLTEAGFFPPDPVIAAGPSNLIAVVNGAIALFSKTGTNLLQRTLTNFYNGTLTGTFAFDPKIVYDPHSARYFVVSLDGESSPNFIRIAVSKSSNPSNLNVGPGGGDDWWGFDIDAHLDGGVAINDFWADFPGLGVDQYNVYVTANMYSNAGLPQYARVWVMRTAGLMAGGPLTVFEFGGPPSPPLRNPVTSGLEYSIQPALNFDLTNEHMLTTNASAGGMGHITVWTVNTPATTPTLTSADLIVTPWNGSTFFGVPDCAQLGGAPTIDTQNIAILNAVQRNGRIWATHTHANTSVSPTRTQVRWYEIDPTAFAVVQSGDVQDAVRCYFYPAIHADVHDNVTLVMSGVDATIYGSAFYTTRLATDPPGMMRPPASLQAGLSHWAVLDSLNRNRWGDYGGIAEDPATGDTWLLHEYADATPNRWSTWIGRKAAVHDSVVLPVTPRTVTVANGATSVTKKLRVTVKNADVRPATEVPGHTIQLVPDIGDCVGATLGTPDFDTSTPPPAFEDTVVLAGGKSKTAVVTLTVPSNTFPTYNRKAPRRCTVTFTAVTLGDHVDPTPDNDVMPVEVSIIDRNLAESSTAHESVIQSVNPATIALADKADSKLKKVAVKVTNADFLLTVPEAGHDITVTADDGDCPPGTVGVADFDPSTTGDLNLVTVKPGKTAAGKLAVTIDASAFTTASAKSPNRCTALLSADGPAGNTEPDTTNNTTKLVIDVVDKNDF